MQYLPRPTYDERTMVERVFGEPIVIGRYYGDVHEVHVRPYAEMVSDLFDTISGTDKVYFIFDVSNVTSPVEEVLRCIADYRRAGRHLGRANVLLVCENGNLRRYSEIIEQVEDELAQMLTFDNMETAVAYACLLHAKEQSKRSSAYDTSNASIDSTDWDWEA
jgi:hypothetical protein